MIARTWHGVTPDSKANEYFDYIKETGVAGLRATKGNLGVEITRRIAGGRADFFVTSYWDSLESIKQFAGENIDIPVYYPKDREFLLELEPRVEHCEVLLDKEESKKYGK